MAIADFVRNSGVVVKSFDQRGEVHLPVFDGAAAVPEPLTILGAGAAIGFGSAFKRKLAQAKKK